MSASAVTAPIAFEPRRDTPPEALKSGDVVDGKYALRERIGEGGMGTVFLADQLALSRTVAIKLLSPEHVAVPDLVRRMHEEAMLACHVRSPHCVEVFDWAILPDGTPYIVMEYVPGRSLGSIIAEGPMPLARALDVFEQILSAIAATHRSGIVHGDVKSDNFLVECAKDSDHVTLIDFGLAQVIGEASGGDVMPDELVISGTPGYMAPEVAAGGAALPASDLYGAGVILYELLTGTRPFGGRTAVEIMARQVCEPLIPPSQRGSDRGIPPEIDRVVLRALDKHPDARFSDAVAFARELRTAAGPLASSRRRCRSARGSEHRARRRGDTEALRRKIGVALRHGDVGAIVDGYLALAGALVERQQVARATSELQEGIDIVTAGRDVRESDSPRCVDRLVVALAGLPSGPVRR